MPSRSGRTDHSLLTCVPPSHRYPELPVRKTDLAERGAPSTCRSDAAMCCIVSFTFRSPRVTAPTSQGVLRNDRLRPNPRRVRFAGYHVSDAGCCCDVLPPVAFAFSVTKLTLTDCPSLLLLTARF